jgi:murein DD-endopeptidase MepM/ murein hydrolase activator NlpD/chromosome segregation ATPase
MGITGGMETSLLALASQYVSTNGKLEGWTDTLNEISKERWENMKIISPNLENEVTAYGKSYSADAIIEKTDDKKLTYYSNEEASKLALDISNIVSGNDELKNMLEVFITGTYGEGEYNESLTQLIAELIRLGDLEGIDTDSINQSNTDLNAILKAAYDASNKKESLDSATQNFINISNNYTVGYTDQNEYESALYNAQKQVRDLNKEKTRMPREWANLEKEEKRLQREIDNLPREREQLDKQREDIINQEKLAKLQKIISDIDNVLNSINNRLSAMDKTLALIGEHNFGGKMNNLARQFSLIQEQRNTLSASFVEIAAQETFNAEQLEAKISKMEELNEQALENAIESFNTLTEIASLPAQEISSMVTNMKEVAERENSILEVYKKSFSDEKANYFNAFEVFSPSNLMNDLPKTAIEKQKETEEKITKEYEERLKMTRQMREELNQMQLEETLEDTAEQMKDLEESIIDLDERVEDLIDQQEDLKEQRIDLEDREADLAVELKDANVELSKITSMENIGTAENPIYAIHKEEKEKPDPSGTEDDNKNDDNVDDKNNNKTNDKNNTKTNDKNNTKTNNKNNTKTGEPTGVVVATGADGRNLVSVMQNISSIESYISNITKKLEKVSELSLNNKFTSDLKSLVDSFTQLETIITSIHDAFNGKSGSMSYAVRDQLNVIDDIIQEQILTRMDELLDELETIDTNYDEVSYNIKSELYAIDKILKSQVLYRLKLIDEMIVKTLPESMNGKLKPAFSIFTDAKKKDGLISNLKDIAGYLEDIKTNSDGIHINIDLETIEQIKVNLKKFLEEQKLPWVEGGPIGGEYFPMGNNAPGGAPITSPFGLRTHPIFKTQKGHTGIDIGYEKDTKLYSSIPGKVIFADWNGGYGNCVMIQSADNKDHVFLYGHLSSISTQSGKDLKPGDAIGTVGSTGNSTASHLHYEFRNNGRIENPLSVGYAFDVASRAKGGITNEDYTVVGERGRELAILPNGKITVVGNKGAEINSFPNGTHILPNNTTEKILGYNSNIANSKVGFYSSGTPTTNEDYKRELNAAAKAFDIPVNLLYSIMAQESSNGEAKDTWGYNKYGAHGLMQITKIAIEDLKQDNPVANKTREILSKNNVDLDKAYTGGSESYKDNIWVGAACLYSNRHRYFANSSDWQGAVGWYYAGGKWNSEIAKQYRNEVFNRADSSEFSNLNLSEDATVSDTTTNTDNSDDNSKQVRTGYDTSNKQYQYRADSYLQAAKSIKNKIASNLKLSLEEIDTWFDENGNLTSEGKAQVESFTGTDNLTVADLQKYIKQIRTYIVDANAALRNIVDVSSVVGEYGENSD